MMKIERLDHLVLTVEDIERTIKFYVEVMGMESIRFGNGRHALCFGQQKINLHPADEPIAPHAKRPTPGSSDLCFITSLGMGDVLAHLEANGVGIEEGPVARTGALGPIQSVYFRDPDGNLIEVSLYAE